MTTDTDAARLIHKLMAAVHTGDVVQAAEGTMSELPFARPTLEECEKNVDAAIRMLWLALTGHPLPDECDPVEVVYEL